MSDELGVSGGIPRRELIRKGAVFGGALVWATPVVQSVGSSAFAAGPGSPPPCGCDPGTVIIRQQEKGGTRVVYSVEIVQAPACGSDCEQSPGTLSYAWSCANEVNITCSNVKDQPTLEATIQHCTFPTSVDVTVVVTADCGRKQTCSATDTHTFHPHCARH